MMKHILTSLVALVITGDLLAQHPTFPASHQHKAMLKALLQPQMQNVNSRTMMERVIAQSTWDNLMGNKSDSVKLLYPLNGTSTYDYNMMLYPYNYPYSTSPMFNYLGTFTSPQVQYSRYDHWTVNPNTLVYGFYQRNLAEYDANMNLIRDTSLFADSAIYPNMRYANGFAAANKIDSSRSYVWDSGVSTNAFKQYFSYDVSNRLIKDSIYEYDSGSWYKVGKTLYTYDGSGNLVQIDNYSNNTDTTFTLPLIEQLKYVNTYDASGRLKTVHSSIYDGTMLKPYVIDSFAYSGTIPFHLSWKQYQYDPINFYWAPMFFMTKSLNASMLPDIVNINTYDSLAAAWVPYYRWNISYNASDNPIKLDEYIYNWTSFPSSPDFTTRYYYEIFNLTTGCNEPGLENGNVYPNPAMNFVHVSGLPEESLPVIISFTDQAGRMVSREKATMLEGRLDLSAEHLRAGGYILSITEINGKPLLQKRLTICR